MARPTRRTIASGIASFDADIDANFDYITGQPFPMYWVATTGELPTASSYDDCMALVGTSGSARLYYSNGSTWELYDNVSANVPDSTATTVADMASDFNDLLAALIAAGIMASS